MKDFHRSVILTYRSITTLAMTTVQGVFHQKALLLVLVFLFFLLGGMAILGRFSFQEELQLFQESALGMLSFSLSIIALVATGLIFSHDKSAPGLVLALSKPLPRLLYLLGKLVGLFLFLTIVAVLMGLLFFLLLLLHEKTELAALSSFLARTSGSEKLMMAIFVHGKIGYASLLQRMLLALIQSWLLSAATLVVAMLTSSSFLTILLGVVVAFIGHIKAGLNLLSLPHDVVSSCSHQVLMALLFLFPDLSLFDWSDRVAVGTMLPEGVMLHAVMFGFMNITIYWLLASLLFQQREF